MYDRQAQAGSFLLRCEKWLEYPLAVLRGNSGALIFDADDSASVPAGACGDEDSAALGGGLNGVEDEVEDDLLEQLGIGALEDDGRVDVALDLDAAFAALAA